MYNGILHIEDFSNLRDITHVNVATNHPHRRCRDSSPKSDHANFEFTTRLLLAVFGGGWEGAQAQRNTSVSSGSSVPPAWTCHVCEKKEIWVVVLLKSKL